MEVTKLDDGFVLRMTSSQSVGNTSDDMKGNQHALSYSMHTIRVALRARRLEVRVVDLRLRSRR
jgi:hypothetical protein